MLSYILLFQVFESQFNLNIVQSLMFTFYSKQAYFLTYMKDKSLQYLDIVELENQHCWTFLVGCLFPRKVRK